MFIWALQRHAQHLIDAKKEPAAQSFLQAYVSQIVQAGQALMRCVDADSGLACAYDNNGHAQAMDLLGAVTTTLGLEAASDALDIVQSEPETVTRMRAFARQLRGLISSSFVDVNGYLTGEPTARALALYPLRLYAADTELERRERDRLRLELRSDLALESDGVSALALRMWALVAATPASQRDDLGPLVRAFFAAADQRSGQYGAVQVAIDSDGDALVDTLEHRVGTPYLPAGALAYMTALEFFGRRPPLASSGPLDSCFCYTTTSLPRESSVWLVLLIGALFGWRRRRRGEQI
jgi:MYXO-CTERM domain-containing protein